MREQVERACPHLLEQAIDELGVDPFERVDDGTAFVQPALYCASLAVDGSRPSARGVHGRSLARRARRTRSRRQPRRESDGLSLAVTRGRVMQDAAESCPQGGMLAALGDGDRRSRSPSASV